MACSSAEGKIKPIDRAAVHRICSGQVVLDLATAVKELVENSLDAGATSIDIRLKDHGSEVIEVVDNGAGVSPDNYQGLTLKYHTSKISKFADLQSLSSFGFRGEALSSLCALAKLSIVTRTKNEPIAVRLEYDHSGVIISQQNIAREIGTTVSVVRLFSPLPVRFKEFRRENNLRREYGRLLSVLQGYALIAKGVRIICSHQAGKAGRTVVVKTQGNTSMRDNLVMVFGTKTASCMESLDLIISDTCNVEGFVSKPGAGCGRPSGDRQFFYVNGRPVDLPKVAKLLNELYRSFNSLQYPMAVLNFILPTSAYDVNVTPDKRKLFLHSENELLAALRGSLEKVYTPTKYTYTINSLGDSGHLSGKGTSSEKNLGKSSKDSDSPIESDAPTDACSDEEDEAEREGAGMAPISEGAVETEKTSVSSGRAALSLLSFQHKVTNAAAENRGSGTFETASLEKNPSNVQSQRKSQATLVHCTSRAKRAVEESHGVLSELPLLKRWRQLGCIRKDDEDDKEEFHDVHDKEGGVSDVPDGSGLRTFTVCNNESPSEEEDTVLPPLGHNDIPANKALVKVRKMVPCSNGKQNKILLFRSSAETEVEKGAAEEPGSRAAEARECGEPDRCCGEPAEANDKNVNQVQRQRLRVSSNRAAEVDRGRKVAQTGDSGEEPFLPNVKRVTPMEQETIQAFINSNGKSKIDAGKKVVQTEQMAQPPQQRPVIQFDMDKLQKRLELASLHGQTNSSSRKQMSRRKSSFAAASLNAVGKDDTEKEAVLKAATKELERSFNKADFKKMKHASDEKYNFERLSKTTMLNRQPLLRPLALELSAAEEMTVVSHLETFRQNGFDFVENENAPAGQRLQLSAVPFSQNVTFGVGDVQELISLLTDEPAISTPQKASSWLPRPSRVRAMLASRACRSSVMIGDPLSKKQMERILSHLAELDAPWNCPHGRPTMRHLLDLSSTRK